MVQNEEEIRAEAYRIWLAEGCPMGRAERHWAEAREIVALRESYATTLAPPELPVQEPVEWPLAVENLGDLPGLTDQGGPGRDCRC
jgi:hypothetical protein